MNDSVQLPPPVDHATDVALMLDCFAAVPEDALIDWDARPRHFRQEVAICDELYIGPLDGLKDDIYDACQPRGMNWVKPHRAFPIEYGMYRRDAPMDNLWRWDSDQRLQTCMMLSRLVRPTSIGVRYAARLIYDAQDNLVEIAPANLGFGAQAWVADESQNWLRDEDIPPLRTLIERFDGDALSSRVRRAFWHFEHASRTAWIDVRWPVMSIALESLVHTDRHNSTHQFANRVSNLATRIDGLEITEEELRDIYDCRSQLAHGLGLDVVDDEARVLYLRMEGALRRILEAIVLDPPIAAIFEDAEAVRRELGNTT